MTTPDLARRLLDAGIPVVVCKPNPAWSQGSTQPDVLMPKGWATITPAEAAERIGTYRPGIDTLAMVGGWGIDVLDVDTKVPGVSFNDLPVEVRGYGVTLSPSGGAHFPTPSTGYGKGALNVAGKHIGDYVGGTATGGGRMLAFLPGSSRPKYGGAQYREVTRWDIARLLDDNPQELVVTICEASENLSKTATEGHHAATTHEVRLFLTDHADAVSCAHGDAELTRLLNAAGPEKRHEWFIAAVSRVTELMKAGCVDASAVDALAAKLANIKPEGGTSAMGCLAWAIGNTSAATECPTHDPALAWLTDIGAEETGTGSGDRVTGTAAEDAVFGATPRLSWIRDLARARMVSPWALLAACTARIIACTGPAWLIPGYVGTPASLNFYVALIGSSNSGKTITSAVAAEALPTALVDIVNPSSGEGLVTMFSTHEKGVDVMYRENVLSVIDEISTLGGQQERAGSTLGSILRSAWSAADISNHAADPTRRRSIRSHTYRYAMVAGVQYDTADVLMADRGAGTPQRFLWIPAADPHAVLDHPEPADGGPLAHWHPPVFEAGTTFHIGYPEQVRIQVRAARLDAVRNTDADRDALLGHMLLVRMKLAAGLALLHETTTVSDEMWAASGHIIDLSTATLDVVMTHARRQSEKAAIAKGHAEATTDETKSRRAADAAARRVARIVARKGANGDPVSRRDIRQGMSSKHALTDVGITEALALGYIVEAASTNNKKGDTFTLGEVPK